jgi:hypothetical protein
MTEKREYKQYTRRPVLIDLLISVVAFIAYFLFCGLVRKETVLDSTLDVSFF